MTWHLKDRELEKKLIEVCPNFLECIDFAIQTKEKDADYIYVEFDRERVNVTLGFNYLYFWDDELEYIPEYNPKDWNEFPAVKPPYNMMMRIKMKNGYLRAGYLKKFPDGDSWVNPNGVLMCNAENAEIELFRPWED